MNNLRAKGPLWARAVMWALSLLLAAAALVSTLPAQTTTPAPAPRSATTPASRQKTEQMRGFTYVDDIARGTLLGLRPLGYELINLGGHETISINQMVALLEELLGRKAVLEYIPRHPADVDANWASVEKARRLLGWEPQVGLRAGMQRLVEWYLAERAWASQVLTP